MQGSPRNAAFFRLAVAVAGLGSLLAFPSAALALAGGSTGGGGGGGGFSGGGGSSYGSGGGSSCEGDECTVGLLIGFGIALLIPLICLVVVLAQKARRTQREMRIHRAAHEANAGDGYWDPTELEARVKECFFPIQMSWENRDIEASRPYVSDSLFERHSLQLKGYEEQNRCNRIADLKLNDIRLVRIHNVTNDGEDRFVVHINCAARDWMEDTKTGETVNGNPHSPTVFNQYWSFSRHDEYGWVLDEIQQGEEGAYHETAAIVNTDEGPLAEPVLDDEPAAAATASNGAPAPPPDAATRAWDGSNGRAAGSNGGGQPANWYSDPQGAHKWRWWDGRRWTAHTAD